MIRAPRLKTLSGRSRVTLAGLVAALAAVPPVTGVSPWSASAAPQAETGGVFEGPVGRAECGPGSRPETAMQGEVTVADRDSGRSTQGYTCNMEEVGNFGRSEGFEGAEWMMAAYGDCAYYSTKLSGSQQKRGTVVVDVSDRTNPRYVTNLTTPGMLDSWESLRVHEGRGLLAADYAGDFNGPGFFDVYDVSGDCTKPELLSSTPFPGLGHEGNFAPDGRTFYATPGLVPGGVTAIDVADPTSPHIIGTFFLPDNLHGLGLSPDGRQLYLAHPNRDWFPSGSATNREGITDNGIGIYDISSIQDRKGTPQLRLLGGVGWRDGQQVQHITPFSQDGKPYVVAVDEGYNGGPRVIDVSDPAHPAVVSKLKIEIQMPENRELAHQETVGYKNEGGGQFPVAYNSHYCSIDRPADPTILACSNFQSGLRVFDIRDLGDPVEIAYYNP
ncbi:MAG: LVIVD repeat-containing protein, partial [Acidimicrobiia bacterium]